MNLVLPLTILLILSSCQACGRNSEDAYNNHGAPTESSYCDSSRALRRARSDCGDTSSTKYSCESTGCCWEPNADAYWCFCPNKLGEVTVIRDELRRRRQAPIQITADCECHGHEGRKPGGGPRELIVICEKPLQNVCNLKGKKQKMPKQQLTCVYKGNPHGAGDYNKNQMKFYNELTKIIGEDMCNMKDFEQCPTKTYTTTNTAGNIEFKFESQERRYG